VYSFSCNERNPTPPPSDKTPLRIELMKHQLSKKNKQGTTENNNGDNPWADAQNAKFKKTTSSFLLGAARTTKESFMDVFEMGLPSEDIKSGGSDVLVLYQAKSSLPSVNHKELRESAIYNNPKNCIPSATADIVTESCTTMNVISTNPRDNQCTAIVGNYESYHVQKWMRLPETKGALDRSLPLRFVSRVQNSNGVNAVKVPMGKQSKYHWNMLGPFLDSFADSKSILDPILSRINKNKVVAVLTCNFGQSELLINFVCSAKSRGLDISNVLVFATDEETRDLAIGLGLEAFYDEKIYKDVPTDEAGVYGDKKFSAMMYAKVVCVQMVLMLGYDVLFQDVDIVWYKDPMTYLQNPNMINQNYDVYFQDDGNRQPRYAPYSANSGFYFVRHNDRTQYLFTALLYAGDAIKATGSHQQVLVGLLAEHSSLFGLKVKILDQSEDGFPGGYHYHNDHKFMRRFVKGETDTYLFHMSWTHNKVNKIKFFQQMGDWYVNDKCVSTKPQIILNSATYESKSLIAPCCAAEPLVSCHYRDKPSKIPCRDSQPIDNGGRSFW